MLYVFTNLNNERDTDKMKIRLHEKYISVVITACCRTNNRGRFHDVLQISQIFKSSVCESLIIKYSLYILHISGI